MKKLFLPLLALVLFSCGGSDDAPAPVPVTSNARTYFKATIDGQALNYRETNSIFTTHQLYYINGYQGSGTRGYYYGGVIAPVSGGYPEIGLAFENIYVTNDQTTVQGAFTSMFATTPTNFITEGQNNDLVKGVSISYQLDSETSYSTLVGSQLGSTMTIISSTEGIETGGTLKIRTVVGTVNCKLYNYSDPSDVITLTNGQFKIIVRQDF